MVCPKCMFIKGAELRVDSSMRSAGSSVTMENFGYFGMLEGGGWFQWFVSLSMQSTLVMAFI